MIQYQKAPDLNDRARKIVSKLNLSHIDLNRTVFIRSKDSKSRFVLARCHTLSRAIQKALNLRAHYIIEIVSEKFDKLNEKEQIKVLIHELLHIPKSFGGGFRHHDFVNKKTVDRLYKQLEMTCDY